MLTVGPISYEDIIAIHRAQQQGGTEAALGEVRRRWPGRSDEMALKLLDWALRLKVQVPVHVRQDAPAIAGGQLRRFDDVERERERDRSRKRRRKLREQP